jgi:hypothetical protein
MFSKIRFMLATSLAVISMGAAACYYPAQTQPPPEAKTETVVTVPYDLTWDALHSVVNQHGFKVLADDPNHGIIEAEAHSFTLGDADCGQLKSIAGRYAAEPDAGGSAVYNFKAEPAGPESTSLSLTATYTTPLHVPLHPVTDFQCISRGTQEARLLKEIDAASHSEHRPTTRMETDLLRKPNGPTLLGPDILKKPGPSAE